MKLKLYNVLMPKRQRLFQLIMRTFIFLFCTTVFALSSNGVNSQNDTILINRDQSVSIEKIFDYIKEQTDYSFVYNEKYLVNTPIVELKKGVYKVSEILNESLKLINCTYTFDNNVIVVKPKKNGSTNPEVLQQEKFLIKGVIKDEAGFPVPGANVMVTSIDKYQKETDKDYIIRGTSTDFEGNFEIAVSLGHFLIVSSIGFETFKEKITTKKDFYSIVLKESVMQLEAVVISTGYQKTNKKLATGSYSTIEKADLQRQVTTNLVDRLEGLSTGLLTTVSNGNGGDNISLTLRGLSTFNANDQPLIVVDGFPMQGGFNTLNPDDVETMTILKDAAAASIWGTQSANGVIVITTKKGKIGKPTVEFSVYSTIKQSPHLNDLQIATSQELVDWESYRITSGIYTNYPNILNGTSSSYLTAVGQVWYDNDQGTITDGEREARLAVLRNTDNYSQIEKYLMRTSISNQYNFSVSGGSTTNKYYASFVLNDDESVYRGDDSQRVNINFKDDIQLHKKLDLSIGANTTFNKASYNSEGGLDLVYDGIIPRYQLLVDEDGNLTDVPRDYLASLKRFYETNPEFLDWSYNPISELAARDNTLKSMNLRFQAALKWDITNFLKLTASGIYERGSTDRRVFSSTETYEARNEINRLTYYDDDEGEWAHHIPNTGGILQLKTSDLEFYTLRSQLEFDKDIASVHNIKSMLGVEAQDKRIKGALNEYVGYNESSLIFDKLFSYGDLSSPVEYFDGVIRSANFSNPAYISSTHIRNISFFGNLSYAYNNKYIITLTAKTDQSSLFGSSARLRLNKLWSVGGSWNIDEEAFFNVPFINTLKLRGSYGVNGNIKENGTTESVFTAGYTTLANLPYYNLSVVGNPELTLEDTYTGNLGIDFSLSNYRINGSIDVYERHSKNLLTQRQITSTQGYSSQLVNNGEIINRGIELSLNFIPVQTPDFTWNNRLNFTYNKGKVLNYELDDELAYTRITSPYVQGEEIGALISYKWAGLSADGSPQIYDETGAIIDANTTLTDANATTVRGSRTPKYFGSFDTSITYKDLTLGVFLTTKLGHKFRKPTVNYSNTVVHQDIQNRWQETGDEVFTDIPRYPTVNEATNTEFFTNYNRYYRLSDALIVDASYIRIKDLYLKYKLNKNVLDKMSLNSVEFIAQLRNIGFLWLANDYDIDPDTIPFSGGVLVGAGGDETAVSRPGYKPTPQISFGVNVKF